MATFIGCMVKKKSKGTLHQPAMESSVYEMVETDKIGAAAIEVEANSSYQVARYKEAAEQPDYI